MDPITSLVMALAAGAATGLLNETVSSASPGEPHGHL